MLITVFVQGYICDSLTLKFTRRMTLTTKHYGTLNLISGTTYSTLDTPKILYTQTHYIFTASISVWLPFSTQSREGTSHILYM